MSANVPYEIQEEIVKRVVHVKSLLRFRSVSKQWKSLIDSPKFITQHTLNQTRPHHLLVSCAVDNELKYVSVIDDDSFPRNMFYHTLPTILEQFSREAFIISCSHGLVCLIIYNVGCYPFNKTYLYEKNLLVIWNPSVRKYVGIIMPNTFFSFGFGVCPKTGDPKIVQISENWKARVFSLSSRAWRSVPMKAYSSQRFISNHKVEIGGVIYWTFYDYNHDLRVISFDVTSEEFGEVELPECPEGSRAKSISKLNDSLVVLYYSDREAGRKYWHAWKMLKNGASKYCFTKLFTFDVEASHGSKWDKIVGFRMNGQPIIALYGESILEAYDQQGSVVDFGIRGSFLQMTSYMESLILLKDTDSIIE